MSIFNAIANAGSNAGAGINAFAQNQYAVNQDRELNAERQQQNAFAQQQGQAETARQLYMDAVKLGPDAGMAYLADMAPRFQLPPPDPKVRDLMENAQMAQGFGNAPANVQEWNFFSQLPPAEQERYLVMKRAAPIVQMGGGGVGFASPVTGATTPIVTPEAATARDAANAGAVTTAQEGAKIESIPARTVAEIRADFDKFAAEQQQAGMADLGQATANAESAISVIDGLASHPGLDYLVGAASMLPIVPGTPQADAMAYVEQIQGKAFLEAFATLKGGGQITEIEGAKATAAIARLNRAQSKQAFTQALNELRDIAAKGLERAQKKASGPKVPVSGIKSMGQSNEAEGGDVIDWGNL